MTITPIQGGYLLFMNYKGAYMQAKRKTQADCWAAAVEWMGEL